MSRRNRLRRLEKMLEAVNHRPCPQCGDHPSRIVCVDPVTDRAWDESMPADGCPGCGAPIQREITLIIEQGDAPVASMI